MYVTSETIYVWGRANFSAVVEVVEVVERRVTGHARVTCGYMIEHRCRLVRLLALRCLLYLYISDWHSERKIKNWLKIQAFALIVDVVQ